MSYRSPSTLSASYESPYTGNNAWSLSLMDPQHNVAAIPDDNIEPATLQSTITSKVVRTPVSQPDFLFVDFPQNPLRSIREYRRASGATRFGLYQVHNPSKPIYEDFARVRVVSAVTTIQGSDRSPSGTFFGGQATAACYQTPPELQTLDEATLTASDRGLGSGLPLTRLADGISMLCPPGDAHEYRVANTNGQWNTQNIVSVNTTSTDPGWFVAPMLGPGAKLVYDSPASFLPVNLFGRVGFEALVAFTYTDVPATSTAPFTLKLRIWRESADIDGVISTTIDTHDLDTRYSPALASSVISLRGQLQDLNPNEIVRVQLIVDALTIGGGDSLLLVPGQSSTLTVTSTELLEVGIRRPCNVCMVAGAESGQEVLLTGYSNYQAIPTATQARWTKSLNLGRPDPADLLLAAALFGSGQVPVIWNALEYARFIESPRMQEVYASRGYQHSLSFGYLDALKMGARLVAPALPAAGSTVGSVWGAKGAKVGRSAGRLLQDTIEATLSAGDTLSAGMHDHIGRRPEQQPKRLEADRNDNSLQRPAARDDVAADSTTTWRLALAEGPLPFGGGTLSSFAHTQIVMPAGFTSTTLTRAEIQQIHDQIEAVPLPHSPHFEGGLTPGVIPAAPGGRPVTYSLEATFVDSNVRFPSPKRSTAYENTLISLAYLMAHRSQADDDVWVDPFIMCHGSGAATETTTYSADDGHWQPSEAATRMLDRYTFQPPPEDWRGDYERAETDEARQRRRAMVCEAYIHATNEGARTGPNPFTMEEADLEHGLVRIRPPRRGWHPEDKDGYQVAHFLDRREPPTLSWELSVDTEAKLSAFMRAVDMEPEPGEDVALRVSFQDILAKATDPSSLDSLNSARAIRSRTLWQGLGMARLSIITREDLDADVLYSRTPRFLVATPYPVNRVTQPVAYERYAGPHGVVYLDKRLGVSSQAACLYAYVCSNRGSPTYISISGEGDNMGTSIFGAALIACLGWICHQTTITASCQFPETKDEVVMAKFIGAPLGDLSGTRTKMYSALVNKLTCVMGFFDPTRVAGLISDFDVAKQVYMSEQEDNSAEPVYQLPVPYGQSGPLGLAFVQSTTDLIATVARVNLAGQQLAPIAPDEHQGDTSIYRDVSDAYAKLTLHEPAASDEAMEHIPRMKYSEDTGMWEFRLNTDKARAASVLRQIQQVTSLLGPLENSDIDEITDELITPARQAWLSQNFPSKDKVRKNGRDMHGTTSVMDSWRASLYAAARKQTVGGRKVPITDRDVALENVRKTAKALNTFGVSGGGKTARLTALWAFED